jgi:F-type H+-transporting ATPase subunit b
MNELVSAFGIDWHLLVINCINFGLLLAVLWYFLYGPLTKMLEQRREKIAQGVQDAHDAQAKLKSVQDARAGMIAEAGKEADALIANARAAGVAKEKELIAQGEASVSNILKSAEAKAAEMKNLAISESKQEVAKLIVLGMNNFIEQFKKEIENFTQERASENAGVVIALATALPKLKGSRARDVRNGPL